MSRTLGSMSRAALLPLIFLAVLLVRALPAAAFTPEEGAETSMTPSFVWSDGAQFSKYQLKIRRADSGTIVHTVEVDGANPSICDGASCTLAPGSTGYPALGTFEYEWTVFGLNTSSGLWQWWDPVNWSPFYPLPAAPANLTASWSMANVEMTWPAAAGAASYRAGFFHDLYKPAAATFFCTTPTCSGSENVAYIPYGTIRVTMHSCGNHGKCTKNTAETEVTLACPAAPVAPVIVAPASGAVVGGMVPVQFSHTAYSERFRITIVDNGNGATVVNEEVGYGALSCTASSCLRVFPLPPGTYTVTIASSCGGSFGPAATRTFSVGTTNAAPELLAPRPGQQTSVYPLLVWKKIPNVDQYEVAFTATASGLTTKRLATCFAPALCAFDTQKEKLPAMTGAHTATVRVAMESMPYAPAVTFEPSYGYIPDSPQLSKPEDGADILWAPDVTVGFTVDPQVPMVSTEVIGPGGFSAKSGDIFRDSPDCTLLSGSTLSLSCSHTSKVSQYGAHTAVAYAWTFTDAAGSRTNRRAESTFTRPFPVGGSPKASYSIYAQNMQFLPSSPLNGGGSNGYFHSDSSRADALADYINRNRFDVVLLSEFFTMEAKKQLNKRLGWEYNGVSHIDTNGRWDEMTVGSIVAGYFGGWWLGSQWAGAALGFGKNVEDWSREANSGLAIYSKFLIEEYPNKGWDENSRCTTDTFNEIDEHHPGNESKNFKINDRIWFRQYCKGVGADALSAKGIAAAELRNPRTGHPMLMIWSHTQAFTGASSFAGFPNGDFEPSYDARGHQIEDDAWPAVKYLLQRQGADPFDAFILGDWNVPSPQSISAVPRKNPGANSQQDGWAEYSLMYTGPPAGADPRNPEYETLVGDDAAPGDGLTLFAEYWKYFDQRNGGRTFRGFHDLWMQNPAGDPGFTFDPAGNKVAMCHEAGEPCHGKTQFDKGDRYDQVLARFHAANIPLTDRDSNALYPGSVLPGGGHPAWAESKACVQHVRMTKDFGLSDHWGTVIEVGPDAPFCSPNRAKADPHLWRTPENAPLPPPPKDATFDSAAGIHESAFPYGGANEWFYFSEAGGFDVIPLSKDASIPALRVDAYDVRDLSTMIPIADAEQNTTQTLLETCPEAREAIAAEGNPPKSCATSQKRITYRSPDPFFMRIRPAAPNGQVCDTCIGNYSVLFRKRTCKEYWDAVPVGQKIPNNDDLGWFGAGQPRCWFSFDLAKESLESDHQNLTVANLHFANDLLCIAQGGPGACSPRYDAFFYDAAPAPDKNSPPPEPTVEIHPTQSFVGGSQNVTLQTATSWFAPSGVMPGGVMPETGRRKFYAKVERPDTSRPHRSAFPWSSNLKTATFHGVTVHDIQDDLEIEIEICLPIIGCVIDEPKDPFETEDEVRVYHWVNGEGSFDFGVDDFGVDYAGGKGAQYPNTAPGGLPPLCAAYQRCNQPSVPDWTKGTTVNYTGSTYTTVFEKDGFTTTDTVASDLVMCGVSGNAPYVTWQATYFRDRFEEMRNGAAEQPHTWNFSDDCPDDDPQFRYDVQVLVPRLP